jgi:hypothetical protein
VVILEWVIWLKFGRIPKHIKLIPHVIPSTWWYIGPTSKLHVTFIKWVKCFMSSDESIPKWLESYKKFNNHSTSYKSIIACKEWWWKPFSDLLTSAARNWAYLDIKWYFWTNFYFSSDMFHKYCYRMKNVSDSWSFYKKLSIEPHNIAKQFTSNYSNQSILNTQKVDLCK